MRALCSLPALLAAGALSAACSGGGSGGPPPSGAAPPAEPPAAATRLYLAGDGELTVVEVEAARARVVAIPQLAGGDPPYRLVRRGQRLVFYGGDTYAIDVDLSLPPRKLHESWFFVPSALEDRVWVALLDPNSPETERALAGVAEVTSEGVVTVPPVRPPGGRWPVAAVASGLLLERRGGGLDLWDPLTGRIVRRLSEARAGPTHGDLLAWCDGENRLHLTDAAGGSTVAVVPPPVGFRAFACWAGAFAPDGRTLAVPVSDCADFAGDHSLALVEVPSGRVTVVEGSEVPAGYVFVAWASSGGEVFLSGGDWREPRAIVAYRPGAERARRLAVEVPAFYGLAAS